MNNTNIILNIIEEDVGQKFNCLCNDKAKEIFISYIKTKEGEDWLNKTYINLLEKHPLVENVKEI